MYRSRYVSITLALALFGWLPVFAAERSMMQPLVPADRLAEARALKNPLPDSADIAQKGKALYQGKGTCVNCHGASGRGDGPAAKNLHPSPRSFHHGGFWRHRTDGEIFWVIKHGSPGTAMNGFGNVLTDEEIWTLVRYLHSFVGNMGLRRGMGRMGPRACCGPESELEPGKPRNTP